MESGNWRYADFSSPRKACHRPVFSRKTQRQDLHWKHIQRDQQCHQFVDQFTGELNTTFVVWLDFFCSILKTEYVTSPYASLNYTHAQAPYFSKTFSPKYEMFQKFEQFVAKNARKVQGSYKRWKLCGNTLRTTLRTLWVPSFKPTRQVDKTNRCALGQVDEDTELRKAAGKTGRKNSQKRYFSPTRLKLSGHSEADGEKEASMKTATDGISSFLWRQTLFFFFIQLVIYWACRLGKTGLRGQTKE